MTIQSSSATGMVPTTAEKPAPAASAASAAPTDASADKRGSKPASTKSRQVKQKDTAIASTSKGGIFFNNNKAKILS